MKKKLNGSKKNILRNELIYNLQNTLIILYFILASFF